ncbi:MAG: septum site-determining protein MinC [Pseudomonadota bacterium]
MSTAGFQLKASSMTFTSLTLFTPNLDLVEAQLKALVAKTPNFFDATPVLLDLTTVETHNLPLDILKLLTILRQYRLCPIGVKSYSNECKEIAKSQNLAIIAQTETAVAPIEQAAPEIIIEEKPAAPAIVTAKIIDQPVRSGKQIYAKGCDLIITSTVSHGAEVLADGNIHIYGTLNGRALAGVQGDMNAKIFCKNLDAELIAIAGNYLVNEQIPDEHKNSSQFLEIFLEGNKLQFKSI